MDRSFEWLIERVIYVGMILGAAYFIGRMLIDYRII
jgi:hypothetical protein